MLSLWYVHRRFAIVTAAALGVLLTLLLLATVAVRFTGQPSATASKTRQPTQSEATPSGAGPNELPSPAASDVAYWDALPSVTPADGPHFPAIREATQDPADYARSFVTELFTVDFARDSRGELLAWAQYEDSPLRSPDYPPRDWDKVLVDSLTDATWEDTTDTPVPSSGAWLALQAERAAQTVTDIVVSADPQWEQLVVGGYQSPDPLTTVRDVSLTVVRHLVVAGRTTTQRFSIALSVQLGSSPRHTGYGAAVTNNYVVKAVN